MQPAALCSSMDDAIATGRLDRSNSMLIIPCAVPSHLLTCMAATTAVTSSMLGRACQGPCVRCAWITHWTLIRALLGFRPSRTVPLLALVTRR